MADRDLRPTSRTTRIERAPEVVRTGEWYWVTERGGRWLGCVTHLGTNYVELRGPYVGKDYCSRHEERVHLDAFSARCEREPDARAVIEAELARRRGTVARLLGEVKELTARLGVSHAERLTDGAVETQAIATRQEGRLKDYRKALAKAEKTDLPALFKRIEHEHEALAAWMTADLLPLQAQADLLDPLVAAIKGRILNVELYAGLCETVELVADGAPAPLAEPVRVMQRRHYMDEECLANYEAGGMRIAGLPGFDRWLSRPENRDRLLPFPRCVLAFRVRRHRKEDEGDWRGRWIRIDGIAGDPDAWTFLYLRNGERLWRLNTGIEFGERLFPDVSQARMLDGSVLYAKCFAGVRRGDDAELITDGHYETLKAEYLTLRDARSDDLFTKDARQRRKNAERMLASRRTEVAKAEKTFEPISLGFYSWVRFDRRSTLYDDVAAVVAAHVERHNRLVMVLQGLLDRSEVFHPHPPYRLWEAADFGRALVLVHDESRALTSGAAPDFEAYRARLNATLATGSTCVGQDDYWQEREAMRENERQRNDWRVRHESHYTRFTPYGDRGPGDLAQPIRVTRSAAVFEWSKERSQRARRRWGTPDGDIRRTLTVPFARLLNVSAYVPGDFRRFFADPRTRADYLKWAPLLLAAEDWHAKRNGEGKKR